MFFFKFMKSRSQKHAILGFCVLILCCQGMDTHIWLRIGYFYSL